MVATLPDVAQIVVIGGGIIGCSTAYHLASDHHADVLLLEQNQLTSGSTWHAAGLVGQLRSSAAITQLLRYSVDLYQQLEIDTGLATGWKMSGCLRLACNQDRWIEYQRLATTARSFDMEMNLLSPSEVKTLWPLMATEDLVGASYLPSDGQANPADITQALAKAARNHGVKIVEGIRVSDFERGPDGRVETVICDHGKVKCSVVVNCAGIWARQIAAKVNVNVPVQFVKHQYIVTEPIADLAAAVATVRDPDRGTYFKEEVGGLVMGGYERNPKPWSVDLVPDGFEFQLFEDDWDHFATHLNAAIARVPVLADVGIKQMINGPESFTPDGNFILGRVNECANFFIGTGFNAFGIAAAGGAGWVLAHWVAEGHPPLDLWSVDIRRFSAVHKDRRWVEQRTLEAYGNHYAIAFPNAEYQSARPRLTSPLYQRLKSLHAVFGSKLGWERANWFAASTAAARENPSMGRGPGFAAVSIEHQAVREGVGLIDQSSFAKFELVGEGAAELLKRLCANEVTEQVGRVTYTQMLNSRGGIECDLTVAQFDPQHFYLVSGTGFRTHDYEWIAESLAEDPGVAQLTDVTEKFAALSLMGPKARLVLAQVTNNCVDPVAFPYRAAQIVDLSGWLVRALRVSYVGELGWELHVPIAGAEAVFDALMDAGAVLGIRPVGYHAIESLRLEKSFLAWGSDITPSDSPDEAGLDWAVKLVGKRQFIGREAVKFARRREPEKRLATFSVDDPETVLLGRETILRDGQVVGYLRSGGFGHTVGRPIGIGYVGQRGGLSRDFLYSGQYQLVVAEQIVDATIHREPIYDPSGQRMRL